LLNSLLNQAGDEGRERGSGGTGEPVARGVSMTSSHPLYACAVWHLFAVRPSPRAVSVHESSARNGPINSIHGSSSGLSNRPRSCAIGQEGSARGSRASADRILLRECEGPWEVL